MRIMADFFGIGIDAVNNIHTYLGYQRQLSSFCTCFFKINAASLLIIDKMKRTLSVALLLSSGICCAQIPYSGSIFNHVWFNATGNRAMQGWGFTNMDTIGTVTFDSVLIQHPIAIGENGAFDIDPDISSYVLNRYPVDTARKFEFPGSVVVPAHFHGTPFNDFAVINLKYCGCNCFIWNTKS